MSENNFQSSSRKHIIEIHKNYEVLFKLFQKHSPYSIAKLVIDKNDAYTRLRLRCWRITYFLGSLGLLVLTNYWTSDSTALNLCLFVSSIAVAGFAIWRYIKEFKTATVKILAQEFKLKDLDYRELPEEYKVRHRRLRSILFNREVTKKIFANYSGEDLLKVVKETLDIVSEKISDEQKTPSLIEDISKNYFVTILSSLLIGITISIAASWVVATKVLIFLILLIILYFVIFAISIYSQLPLNPHIKRKELLEFKSILNLLESDLREQASAEKTATKTISLPNGENSNSLNQFVNFKPQFNKEEQGE